MSARPDSRAARAETAERLRRRKALEALSPLWATLALVLVYVVAIVFFINICPLKTCRPPDLRAFFAEHNLCDFQGAWLEDFSVERASLWPGRVLWIFISATNVLASLVAVFVCLRLVVGSVGGTALERNRVGRFLRGRWLPLVPVGVLAVSLIPLWDRELARRFLPQVYDILNCAPIRDLPGAPLIGYMTIIVSILPLACLVLASCVIVWPPPRRRQREQELALRMNSLNVLLYAGTAALVTTVLRVSVTFRWGLSYLPSYVRPGESGAAVTKVLENFATAFISTQAGSYTLFLAAVYIPAALILRGRAAALAGKRLPMPQREEWLRSRGLSVSFSEYLPRVVAILGPFLAGPLGDLVGFLTK
ncbi:MAG TPA: hypothetical protein VM914_13200 [Pyrinomonadaceae bacterium]|jgi:hypothetical protein|nr:hypothetical protein [Pyrinomonadaceae bacterium]